MRLIIQCRGERSEHRLREGTTVIGRDPSCDIVLPDPSLSRRHLECRLEGDRLLVRDLKTKNGTFLGTRRIEQAYLPPGVSLRAGNVSLRFEADEKRAEAKPVPPEEPPRAKPAEPLGNLESQVPTSERYEEDEEPTPSVDETPPVPAGAAEEARVVVRDDRWYLRDPATGAEVEIIPVRREGAADSAAAPSEQPQAPAGASREVPAQLPARIARRVEGFPAPSAAAQRLGPGGFRAIWSDPKRRVRLLLCALAAVILLAIIAYALFKPEHKVPVLSRALYRARADEALKLFAKAAADAEALTAEGKNDDAAKLVEQAGGAAVQALQRLQNEPAQGSPKLAEMLIEALQADSAAARNFPKAWEKAQQRWEEVSKSSESTEAATELAQARLAWIEGETTDMITLNDAQRALKEGDDLKAVRTAAGVAKTSPCWKDVEPLLQQATDAILRTADSKADGFHWNEASAMLKELAAARPEIAGSLAAKIKEYDQRDRERAIVEQATNLAGQQKYDEAARLLAQLPAGSPYTQQAASLLAGFKEKQALQLALTEYAAGNGEKALDILSKAGLAGSTDASRIKAVVNDKARVLEELRAGHFAEIKTILDGILRLESAPTNDYVRYARNVEADLPNLTKAGAQLLADEAASTMQGHEEHKYRKARDKLEEALRLDPANKDAKEELNRLVRETVLDFNKALQMPHDTPAQLADELRTLNDVLDRLPSLREDRTKGEESLYQQASREIEDIKALQAKQAPGGNP